MNKVIGHSVNCASCNREVLNYQIRPAKVGSILLDCCPSCHALNDAYKQFKEAKSILNNLYKFGQLNNDAQTMGPSIIIEPIDTNIQAAVELLKRMDGNYFSGVSKIVAGPENNYGHVSSIDSSIININLNRISNETKSDDSKRNIVIAIATTIAHERGHVLSWDGKTFVGLESPALAEESKVSNWIKNNKNRLKDLFE